MQTSPEQPWEVQAKPSEMLVLRFGHITNHVLFDSVSFASKALPDAVLCPGPGDDEVVLAKCEKVRIVQVDRVLEREERTESRIGHQDVVYRPQGRGRQDPIDEAIVHHRFEEAEVVSVLLLLTKLWWRHNVRGRVDRTRQRRFVERRAITL